MNNIIKISILGDTHLGYDYPVKPKTIKPRRGSDFFNNFEYVIQKAVEEKHDLIIHLGDLYNRSKPPALVIKKTFDILKIAATKGIPVIILPGNHERAFIPQTLFDQHELIEIMDKPKTISKIIKGINFCFSGFPFFRGDIRSEYKKLVAQTKSDKINADIKFILFHQAVDGAQVGVQNYTFLNRNDVISVNDLNSDFDLYLSGHIHRYQEIKTNNYDGLRGNLIYPGSVERTSFAEREETKGYCILNIPIDNIFNFYYYFIPLPVRKMYSIKLTMNNIKRFYEKMCDIPEHSVIQLEINDELPSDLLDNIKNRYKEEVMYKDVIIEYLYTGAQRYQSKRYRN